MITKQQFASMQDHSILGTYCKQSDVKKYCEEVLEYGFAAVYVNPCDVAYAKSLIGDRAAVGTVIGFPQVRRRLGQRSSRPWKRSTMERPSWTWSAMCLVSRMAIRLTSGRN